MTSCDRRLPGSQLRTEDRFAGRLPMAGSR